MKMNKYKIIFVLSGIIICAGAVGISTKAQTEKRASNIKSKGIFDYDNGTVVMDASDLTYLADEIDLLEETYKKETVKALNNMNTYFMVDNSTTHNPNESSLDADSAKALSFQSIIDGIHASQSIPEEKTYTGTLPGEETETTVKISAASEENLSLGTAAWVDGELIVGTGEDNNTYYDQSKEDTGQKIIQSFYNNEPCFYNNDEASVSHDLRKSGDVYETYTYDYSLYQTPDEKLGMLNEVRINVSAYAHVNRATGNYASGKVKVSYNLLDKEGKILASKNVGECSFARNKDSANSSEGSDQQTFAVNLMTLSIPQGTEYFQLVVDHVVRTGSDSDHASTASSNLRSAYIQLDTE